MRVKPTLQLYLTTAQLKVLADIFIAAGQLSAGSAVLPFIIPNLDLAKLPMVLLGGFLTLLFWSLSLLSVRKIKQ